MPTSESFDALRSANGELELGLGRFRNALVDVGGNLSLALGDGRARVGGTLEVNGGSLGLDGQLDLSQAADAASWVALDLQGVRADAELAPFLAKVHPALLGALESDGSFAGDVTTDVRLEFNGPLDLAGLASGIFDLDLERLGASGSLTLGDVALGLSPVFGDLLNNLGVASLEKLDFDPLRFQIERGRVTYDKPWQWTIAGSRTTLSGGVGLDGSLALVWDVPVTAALARRVDLLSALEGKTLRVPIGGSATAPDVGWKAAASELLQTELQGRVEEKLGVPKIQELDLGGILRGDADGGGENAPALFQRAESLWAAGQKAEAAAIYQRIRKEFKLSTTYLLNRDRIKKRAKSQ